MRSLWLHLDAIAPMSAGLTGNQHPLDVFGPTSATPGGNPGVTLPNATEQALVS
jgi:hypothetical protein